MATILASGITENTSTTFVVGAPTTIAMKGGNEQSRVIVEINIDSAWLRVADLTAKEPVLEVTAFGVYRVRRPPQSAAVLVDATMAEAQIGTRMYDFVNNVRTVVTSASSGALSLPTLSLMRELMAHSSVRCYIRFGTGSLDPAAPGSGQLILEAGERFHFRLPPSVTHFRVVREDTDGFLAITGVL